MSGIQRKIIVFAIAITFWGNAHATEYCSDIYPKYRNVGFATNNAFNDLVEFTMKNPGVDNTPYMARYNQNLTEFLEATFTNCLPNQTVTTENFTDYLEVLDFSLRNVTVLTDLEKNGAFNCILKQKPKIDHCLEENVDQNITSQSNYSLLFAKSYLSFDYLACGRTKNVEACVLDLLKEDTKCDQATEYVKNLFDFATSNYCNNETMPETNASVKLTGPWSFIIMVSLGSALVLNRF